VVVGGDGDGNEEEGGDGQQARSHTHNRGVHDSLSPERFSCPTRRVAHAAHLQMFSKII
jgi:hypothetical protein